WDSQFAKEIAEGGQMPVGQPVLEKEEVELIRQWIQYGAKGNGTQVNLQTLSDYYNGKGMARIEKPAAPDPSIGFQMHMGPFFLEPGEEVEFYKKEKVFNDVEENVVRFDAVFNDESHHFLLFEFLPGTDSKVADGLRPVTTDNVFQDAQYMAGWVDSDVTELPEGTAYKVDKNGVLDLNYHLINYAANGDSVLAAEAYVNFYTDNSNPKNEMFSELLVNLLIFIPNNGNEVTFTAPSFKQEKADTDSMYVWFLSTHTHKYGTDYDLYLRNPDGSRGEQIYEGFFNTTYDFDQGYYDWEHPGNLYLDKKFGDLLPIAEKDGIIQEAKYRIPGSANEPKDWVYFGLTTEDEMMLSFIQYTKHPLSWVPTGIDEADNVVEKNFMSVYPNPTNGLTSIRFNLEQRQDVNLTVYNSLGQEVQQLYSGDLAAGQANFQFDASKGMDSNGLYLIRLTTGERSYTTRLLHL
ncbi:T9SS type A sorting domain-containing protein, partial [Bacteroidota bacterium]